MKANKYWKKIDRGFLVLVLLLMGIGLIAVFSASTVLSFQRYGHNYYFILRQLIFAGAGLVLMFVFSKIDYHLWKRLALPILLSGIGLLILVLVPRIGFAVGNARSWFKAGQFLIQPSEFVKLAVILYLASWFDRKRDAEHNFWFGLLPPLFFTGVAILLVAIEPDIGTTLMICVIVFCLLLATGTKIRYLLFLFSSGVAAAWFAISMAPYRAARIVTFLDPSVDPQGIGYHINQALLAIGSGGFWGYGLGNSRQKHNYLPEPIGDSIFAVMAEEFGFLRILVVVILFFLLAVKGIALAKQAPDKFGQLVAIGVTSWIGFQALINIGAISNILPLTGITLPFVSYGGSSLLSVCIGVGILLNISRQRL